VRILEIDESRRRISLSVKRAEAQNLPLRDLIPTELAEQVSKEAAAEGDVPDLDVSEEVFPEAPPADDQGEADRGDAETDEAPEAEEQPSEASDT
jgi:small subunit ribosomal protein S1